MRWAGLGLLTTVGLSAPAVAATPAPRATSLRVASTRVAAAASLGTDAVMRQQRFELHGLPVRGAYETTRERGADRRVVAARQPQRAPQLRPSQALVTAASLPARIANALHLPTAPIPAAAPQLVYVMVLDQPVLAWEVDLPMTRDPEPDRRTVWLSAATGRLLQERQHVFSSRARVFAENPSKTPVPIEIELSDLSVTGPGFALEGAKLRSLNCVDEPEGEPIAWWDEGECYAQATLLSDENGDFFVPLPNVVEFSANVQPTDGYAELSMFAHADRFLAHAASLGVVGFDCETATLVANFRDLAFSDNLPYEPLNNAYYTGECDPEAGPTMLFGQGSEVDFGYDGDVVYHEMGHGIVAHVTVEGLGNRAKRSDGFVLDARALNEFFADYLSFSLTNDPDLAEYVGRFWAANSRPYIRSAENQRVCPDNIANQEHNDSEPMTAALWATRRQADNPRGVDRLVIETLARVAPDETLDGAAQIMVDVAETLMDEGTLTPHTIDVLVRSLDARGLLDCPRVITDLDSVRAGRGFSLLRVTEGVAPFWPSPMQLRYVVPDGGDDILVRMGYRASDPDDPLEPRVLIKIADAPIEYTYDLAAVDVPPEVEVPEGEEAPDEVSELVLVGGDWDRILEPTRLSDREWELNLGGFSPGQVLHVTVVNAASENASVSDFRVLSSAEIAEAEGEDDGGTDDGAEAPADEDVAPGLVISGCGCRWAPDEDGRWPWLFLPWLGLARRRRRRTP